MIYVLISFLAVQSPQRKGHKFFITCKLHWTDENTVSQVDNCETLQFSESHVDPVYEGIQRHSHVLKSKTPLFWHFNSFLHEIIFSFGDEDLVSFGGAEVEETIRELGVRVVLVVVNVIGLIVGLVHLRQVTGLRKKNS